MTLDALPFLDLRDPAFSTRGPEMLAARAQNWCARTPFGLAVLHHRQAGLLLRDRRCRQGSHAWPDYVGLTGSFAQFWSRSVISQEGDGHKLLRRVAQAALAPEDILALAPDFETIAQDLLPPLPASLEFVADFTEPFAGQAITTLLGLPRQDAPQLAKDASTLGLAMGIDAKDHETSVNAATDHLMSLSAQLLDDPATTGFVDRLRTAASTLGVTDRQALLDLIVISIFGGVDTTRAQLAFLMALFADHPDHWTRLRSEPEFIPAAIEEVVRLRPTTTWASRETVDAIALDGVDIPKGCTLHILVHATATDPTTGHSGGFDPFAARKVHFGFGGGAHHCLGQFVARTDMACALRVLLGHVARVEWAGDPVYLPDSGNTSPVSMPLRLMAA